MRSKTFLENQKLFCEEGGAEEGSEEMEPASLASLVESTFVMAAAGNSYQEGLKSFIATIKEAYERGYTVPALTMEVSFVPTKVCFAAAKLYGLLSFVVSNIFFCMFYLVYRGGVISYFYLL